MRCPGARRTVHLPQVLSVFDARNLAGKSVDKDSQFLADRDRSCRLTVRSRKHRDISAGLGKLKQARLKSTCARQPDLADCGLNVQRVCKVIDVFGGCEDVNQRTQLGKDRIGTKEGTRFFKSIVDVVLDCFDVVTGFGFDVGEFGNGISVEFPRKRAQIVDLSVREQGSVGNDSAAK